MKKIVINNDNRRFNISSIVVGYLEENKEEVLEFEIPEKYAEYGKKACFSANGQTFAKNFDDIISNKLTITRDISQFKELDMTIEFFKIENEDEIVARTSILHILIENAIVCDDDIKPDEPKIIILDNLIDEVTKLDVLVTKNEEKREEYYQEIQKKVDNGDFNGATFTPSVDTDGNISWSNDKNLSNPTTQNIKGPKGEKGDTYNLTEQDKKDISSMTVESSESTFNQYYNGKLEDFNSNATSKTNDYNTNATNKTTEYNNNAISKLQEYNTNADNKIAEYDLHSQELNNKIVSTRNELERVKNDVLETGTDTNTYIHLEDSAMAEYQELSVDGVCEQETSTGKNLFDESIMPTNTMNGIKWEYTNKKIKISGTATDTYSNNENIPITLQAGTYYFVESVATNLTFAARFYNIGGELIANSQRYNPFTISENATRIELLVKGVTSGTSYNQEMNFMVSTTNGNYEPYTGGQPSPSPDYPQEIKTITDSLKITSCNNGLFDGELRQGSWNSMTNSDRCFNKNNIYVEPGNYLLITDLDIDNYRYGILVSNDNYPLQVANFSYDSGWKQANKFEFNLTEAGNLGINVSSINNANVNPSTFANVNWLLIKLDLVSIIQANLPEGEFIGKINDTYKDTLKVEYNETDGQYHLVLNKNIGKVVLDGSENWQQSGTYTNEKILSAYSKVFTDYKKFGEIKSTHFKYYDRISSSTMNEYCASGGDTFRLSIFKSTCGTIQELQNWLNTNKPLVYYPLATPYVLDLGIVDMPITYNEITNLFTDSDLMPTINAKYYRNFISTVRNLQVNEKALKQELADINNRLSALETAQTSVASESEVAE